MPAVIAEVSFFTLILVLDLVDASKSHSEHSDDLLYLTYSALISSKHTDNGWHKPAYVFSCFVADCARVAGFQAVTYPSTRIIANNFNLAIIDPSINLQDRETIHGYADH